MLRSGAREPSPASLESTATPFAWLVAGWLPTDPQSRARKIDPYLPLDTEALPAFPTLTAARLYGMVYERGYRGHAERRAWSASRDGLLTLSAFCLLPYTPVRG